MVFKYSQQDKGELTLTEYEVYLHQTHILTEVKVEKDLTWISKIEWSRGMGYRISHPTY